MTIYEGPLLKEPKPFPGQLGRYPFGMTLEFLRMLVERAGGDDALLERWLMEYLGRGEITDIQATGIWDWVVKGWELAGTAGLPAGATWEDIYARYRMRNLPVSDVDWERLQQGLEMERGLAAEQLAEERGVARAAMLGREPKEELTLKEKYERAKRFKGKYERYAEAKIGERLGLIAGEVTEREIAEFEPDVQDIYGQELKGRAGEVERYEKAAEKRGGWRREREPEEERVLPPYIPPERVDVTGPPSWQNWFERKYYDIVRQYWTKEPKLRTEETWASFLEEQTKKQKETWWSRGAYLRGERPAAFAPRIRTVSF